MYFYGGSAALRTERGRAGFRSLRIAGTRFFVSLMVRRRKARACRRADFPPEAQDAKTGVVRSYTAKLSTEQENSLKVLDAMGRTLDRKINIVDSIDTEGGKANAYFDPKTNEYTIALDSVGEAYLLVAAHENVHDIAANNREGYAKMESIVMDTLESLGLDEETLMDVQRALAPSENEAYWREEIVANTVPSILSDEATLKEFVQKMAGADVDTRSAFVKLLDTMRDFLRNTFDKLKNELSWQQMQIISENQQAIERIRSAYFEALDGLKKRDVSGTGLTSGKAKFSLEELANIKPATRRESLNLEMTDKRNLARLAAEITEVLGGEMPESQLVLFGKAPEILVEYMKSDKPLYMPQKMARKVMLSKEEIDGKHELGRTVLDELPYKLSNPMMITGNTTKHQQLNDNSIVVWTDWKTKKDGASIIVPIRIDVNGTMGVYNNINSVFDAHNKEYVADLLREGNVLYRRNGESTEIEQSHQRKVLKENDSGASVDSTVAQSETEVNPESQPRFSRQDSDGNNLTTEQQEYFKNSKVRDEQGRLLVMHHGTPYGGFTVFRSASYFTQNKNYADVYQSPNASMLRNRHDDATNPMTYDVYLNMEKPFDTRNAAEREIFENEYYRKYGTGTPLMESGLPDWTDGMDLQEFIEENEYDYDGLILDEGGVPSDDGGVQARGLSYVVFDPSQAKDVSNKQPTRNPDIRFSRQDGGRVLELGGFPIPSIAVLKATQGHDRYGDVSVVFDKATIDPEASTRKYLFLRSSNPPLHPPALSPAAPP